MILADTIKGLTIKIGSDTKEFQKGIKQVDRDIKETSKQADNLTKALAIEFDAGRFTEAQRLAQSALDKTEDKAKALREQMEYLQSTGADVNSEGYKKLQTQLAQTEADAVKLKAKLEEIKQLKFDSMAKQFETVGNGITTAGKALSVFSVGATAVLGGLAKVGTSTVSTADEIATLATQVGLSAEALQKWQYIAMQTDVSDSELQSGLTKVQAAIASMASGETSSATEALEKLGISAEDASKGMEANFEKIIQTLSSIEDPIMQASYANELFGSKLGSKLIPLLQAGGNGVRALSEEFESLGYMTNEQVAQFSEFDNVMNKIKYQFENIKNKLGVALLPIMEKLASSVETKVIPAVEKLTGWFESLSTAQVETVLKITAVVAALGPMMLILGKMISGIPNLLKGLKSISSALSVLSAHPVILIIGVVAGLIALLYTKCETFREAINNLISTLGEALQPILDMIMSTLQSLMEQLEPIISVLLNSIGEVLTPIIQTLSEVISQLAGLLVPVLQLVMSVIQPILQIVTTIVSVLVNLLKPAIEVIMTVLQPVLQVMSTIIGTITSFLLPVIDKISEHLKPLIEMILGPVIKAFTTMGEVIGKVFTQIPSVINKVLSVIEKMINSVLDFINGIIREINKLGGWLGISISELNHVKLQLHTGNVDAGDYSYKQDAINYPKTPTESTAGSAQNAVTGAIQGTSLPVGTVNNDYSTKDITINVTIQNYAEEIDTDKLIQDINLKLAEQM